MPSFLDRITADIADAMRRRDRASLAPLRMLKTALVNREVERGRPLDEAESLQVVGALVKQRRDAIDQFRTGGRQELADREQAEVDLLERYLPPAADEAAVAQAIDTAIAATGASSPKDMGRVMKAALDALAGLTVDRRALSETVKRRLAE
jgi:uncharacterized protein YqeY